MSSRLVVVDDFFEDPDDIRKFALKQTYRPSDNGQWPGVRTEYLHIVNEKFTRYLANKLAPYIGEPDVKSINMQAQFQLIKPFSDDPKALVNRGNIHIDSAMHNYTNVLKPDRAGIIYLTPGVHGSCGTSMFAVKPGVKDPMFPFELKSNLYKKNIKLPGYDEKFIQHLDSFTETARVNNVYNRLVTFNSDTWHGCNNFHTGIADGRLTLVFFVELLR